ncbi:MAG: patatin-like phospholipase family protein [Thermoanaerobaculales bacterium]
MGLLDLLRGRTGSPEGVVLALGGGGARGLGHIGVLAEIEGAGIPVVGIAGSSAGAVVGAMWLLLGSAEAVNRRWREFLAAGFPRSLPNIQLTNTVRSRDNLLLQFARRLKRHAIVALALEQQSFLNQSDLDEAIAFLVPDLLVADLNVPFAAVCTDFATGQPVALHSGALRRVLAASSAIPAVVPPYLVEGRALIDGGTVADVPVAQARLLSRRPVIAVDVGESPAKDEIASLTLPRALLRGSTMTHQALREASTRTADLVIRPEVGMVHWSEFGRLDELVEAGRVAAAASVPHLRALAQRRSRKSEPEPAAVLVR